MTGGASPAAGASSAAGGSSAGGTAGGSGGAEANAGGTNASVGGTDGTGGLSSKPGCATVDGKLAYGPIGEPQLLDSVMALPNDCEPPSSATALANVGGCWTGERHVVLVRDERGGLLITFDEAGEVVREEVAFPLVTGTTGWGAYSRNGEAMLIVLEATDLPETAQYVVVDQQGVVLRPAQPIYSDGGGWVLTSTFLATADGWLGALGYETQGNGGLLLFDIGVDGSYRGESFTPRGGHLYYMGGFVPSAVGGYLLLTRNDSGGQFSSDYTQIFLVDDELQVVYDECGCATGTGVTVEDETRYLGIVPDAEHDLLFGQPQEWMTGDPYVVQEYGCLQ